jgi:hypothetical protein
MGMLQAEDLTGVENSMALRIIAAALSIAPGLDDLEEGRNRQMAIAILLGVAKEAKTRGARHIKSQRMGPGSVEYVAASDWFTDEDRTSLRALCLPAPAAGNPIGVFPKPGLLARLWPEQQEQ